MNNALKSSARLLLGSIKLCWGALIYFIFKKTPECSYQSMITLFCLTGGFSNDLLSRFVAFFNGTYQFKACKGALGDMSNLKYKKGVIQNLEEKGWHVFEDRLPTDICDRLLAYATSEHCLMRNMDRLLTPQTATIYSRGSPSAVRYDFMTRDLLKNPDIQALLADLSFAQLAQDYLKSRPTVDVLSMWWHTAYSDMPDAEAAQYYHYDMDRLKWIKFFIYLTDVGPENGPHSFVEGSHKTNGIPAEILKKGYARLSDEEINKFYDSNKIIEFSAPKGTIIAEDTRGLHKGKHVENGDRLILQIQYSNSLFGANSSEAKFPEILFGPLEATLQNYPRMYTAYT